MFNSIGIIARFDDKASIDLSYKIYKYLKSKNLKVIFEKGFPKKIGIKSFSPLSKMDVDLIITIGGDGTVLKTCMFIPKPETPILAVNMGRRGHLTEVEPKEAIKAIEKCLEGEYYLEKHDKLSVILENKKIVDGLNEILIASIMPWKMMNFEVNFDKDLLLTSSADALIIATSTGSTAHALSAGGPIVHNSLNAFLLVFLAPLEPISPIVIPNDIQIVVKTKNPKLKTFFTIDGRCQKWLGTEQKLIIRKSDNRATFMRLEKSFAIKNLLRTRNASKGTV